MTERSPYQGNAVRHDLPNRFLGGAELPSGKNLDQLFREMATDRFQVFGRIAGQQNAGPLANLSEAPEFVEEFQNYLGMKRRTELIGHAAVPQVPAQ
jgi:hypothetical protein